MKLLELFIAFFISRFIYDLILYLSKPIFLKSKEKIKFYFNKLRNKIYLKKNKKLCDSCRYYDFLKNSCNTYNVSCSEIKKCNLYTKFNSTKKNNFAVRRPKLNTPSERK